MSTIGIIGYGFVGRAVAYGFVEHDQRKGWEPKHTFLYYDKYKEGSPLEEVLAKSDYLFMALPTPFYEDDRRIDLSIYDKMIDEIAPKIAGQGKIVIIKSTVVPGTTKRYAEKYPGVPFAFNPEFLTEANYLQDFVNADRVVVGADNNWIAQKIIDLYRTCFPSTIIVRMSTTAAEVVKYQCNVILATRVAISNIFYDICQVDGVSYDDVRKAVGLDHRIGESHLQVSTERGFGGKCFPKDLGAIIGRCKELGVDCKVLEEIHEYNLRIRKVYDWQEIAGASVGGRRYSEDSDKSGPKG